MDGTTAVGAAVLVALGLLYVVPSLVAARRAPEALPRLLQLNVFLGWTVVVWLYCLWKASRPAKATPAADVAPPPPDRGAPPLAHRSPRHDRMPDWVGELPGRERAWRALPNDTAPLRPEYRPEDP